MTKKNLSRVASVALGMVLCTSVLSPLAGCGSKGSKKSAIVLMTEEPSRLFNPFYATSGTDMDIVGNTQIGMLSTNSEGKIVAGADQPCVVLDYKTEVANDNSETTYTFVLKNGLKFSDGQPLTMNDVLFNMYELLDPVYTGSSTMYSIDIKGLTDYRTQQHNSGNNGAAAEETIANTARSMAGDRLDELMKFYTEINNVLAGEISDSYEVTEAQMRQYIADTTWNAYGDTVPYTISKGYKEAVATEAQRATIEAAADGGESYYRAKLLEDYESALTYFKKELDADFSAAQESFDLTTAPYKDWTKEFSNEIFRFFFMEGEFTADYEKKQGTNVDDKTKIKKLNISIENYASWTREQAIDRIYSNKVKTGLLEILQYWGTAGSMATDFEAAAKDIILSGNKKTDGSLEVTNIEGIKSLGHTTSISTVTINNVTYNVAQNHKADGTPANANEYDVLQISINGIDPKALNNFGFTVAPCHYYANVADAQISATEKEALTTANAGVVDIANNKFGVAFANSTFQAKVIQAPKHVSIPMGAGVYVATDRNDSDNPSDINFYSANVVYFKKNPHFMFEVQHERMRMQVVNSSNAVDKLVKGEVDYITPQFTKAVKDRLDGLAKSGIETLAAWQLGYGYIGVNAGKIADVNIRRAIMAAMETGLACDFYSTGTCKPISWPMSTVSWAYPFESDGTTSKDNGHDYANWDGLEEAKEKIQSYCPIAPSRKFTFTIAGASIAEHPTYNVFKQAAEILTDLGWNVEVKADSQALTKLSTGSLEVWAAAWGAGIDPDMYQVYHKNSNATSVYSWGYREIKKDNATYAYEQGILDEMSELIDQARETLNQDERAALYEQAMGYVLDLAVELPVYQRKTLYAYNSKAITGLKTTVNPYSSPLEKIWEVKIVK